MRERLSRDAIVHRAIEVADREGVAAVTIRRLADDHGVTPMALYWHFKDKEELFDGIAERLFADVTLPLLTGAAWHTELRAVLGAFLAAIRPHPTVADLALTRILASDAGLTIADRVLGLLRQARFSPEQAAEVGSYLLCAIITLVRSEPGPERALDEEVRDAAVREKRARLHALSPKRFPNVVASADALADCANEDSYFERGLDLLVEGTRGIQPG
ncbi:TetR/AcrR family transcriptional regulator C-terminal domain-containing protein [Dactylosporangium sp. NPDC005572]|uniref:TetR/AcrR family transcriptional regulator n=1 Tax=Dactylosporangium sp. NPDC005572 TaxID=3156889 RepID=UPI0033BB537E